jgi:hypothetical protein
MRLTIVADDGAVGVDGYFFESLDLSQLDPTIHAVQWYGNSGEVEYKTRLENGNFVKPQNQAISSIALYQFALDAWNAAKADQEQALEAQAAAFELEATAPQSGEKNV